MKTLGILFLCAGLLGADDGIRVVSWPVPPASAQAAGVTTSSVSNSGAVMLLASRTARLKVILFNEKETLYIKAGLGASVTDYTWRVSAATALDITTYTGPLTAILGVVGPTTVHVTDF